MPSLSKSCLPSSCLTVPGTQPALHRRAALALLATALVVPAALAQPAAASKHAGRRLTFDGRSFTFRWSQKDQYEFTPDGQEDLKRWTDMATVNLHRTITGPEQLAQLANGILGRSRQIGKVLKGASKPATATSPAEHMVVAVLGKPDDLEAAFTRVFLHNGMGVAFTYSHRIRQADAPAAMSGWINAHGNRLDNALVAWREAPLIEALIAG